MNSKNKALINKMDSRISSMRKKLPLKKYMPGTKKLTKNHLAHVKEMSQD